MRKHEVLIVGGGLAGLVSALLLVKDGHAVTLVEKKVYPFHRVCGEYVSNEVLDFLKRNGLYPDGLELPNIDTFEFSDTQGSSVRLPLDLGGFGISRYVLDEWLYRLACQRGVNFLTGTTVTGLQFVAKEELFQVELSDFQVLQVPYVLGAFGKRSKLDQVLERPFFSKRSPYIGVKYHVQAEGSSNTVACIIFRGVTVDSMPSKAESSTSATSVAEIS